MVDYQDSIKQQHNSSVIIESNIGDFEKSHPELSPNHFRQKSPEFAREQDSERDNSINNGVRINTTVVCEDEDQEEHKDGGADYRMMAVEWMETDLNFLFSELSETQDQRVRQHSKYAQFNTWSL